MKIWYLLLFLVVFVVLGDVAVQAHLCDNVFRQANKLIVKPENYNLVVKDETSFKIFLQNNMDRGIAEISLLAESPAFDFEVTPKLMRIPQDQRVFFTVNIKPKPGVKTGSYPIHFRLVGGGRQFKSFSLAMQSGPLPVPVDKSGRVENILIVKSSEEPLSIDGKLDEDFWKNAGVVSNFTSIAGGEALNQTVALLRFDQDKFYIGIYCLGEEEGDLTGSDNIEIQLTTEEKGDPYYVVDLPLEGSPSFKEVSGDKSNLLNNSKIQYALAEEKQPGIAEIVIPWVSMGINKKIPKQGKKLYLRISRVHLSDKPEESYWAADASGYNREEGFGEVMLVP